MPSDGNMAPVHVGRRWREHLKNRAETSGPLRVGVAASHTVEPIEPFIGTTLLDQGFADPIIAFADYGQVHAAALAPDSAFGADVDHLVIVLRIEDLFEAGLAAHLDGSTDAASQVVEAAGQVGAAIATAARGRSVTVALAPRPRPAGVDPTDPQVAMSLAAIQRAFNDALQEPLLGLSSVTTLDTEALLAELGHASARDATKWAMYRQPYSTAAWALLGNKVAMSVARGTVPVPKCIVLDCDNTLWGGVVGEDGLSGIELSQDFPGRMYAEFQQAALHLRHRGVMLAICSKNEEADVREVFDGHDDMRLGSEDIVAWRVNWRPKSENIREIAEELNIGLDAVVFVDDSDHEIGEVSSALPEVTVLQVPEDPAQLPNLLTDSGVFWGMRSTQEDRTRTQMMLAEGARRTASESMTHEDYLGSLDLRATIELARPHQIGRVAQLINKTNQFNLTTIRRTEAEVVALAEDPAWSVWALQLEDRYGDYGLVGVALVRQEQDIAEIDTLLMSCRVLGRNVETAFLSTITTHALATGAGAVVGLFTPTRKNAQVADLYTRHGFEETAPGTFRVAAAVDVPPHVSVITNSTI